MKVKMPTVNPRMTWPLTHWPKTRSTIRTTAQMSNRQACGMDASNVVGEDDPVLEQIEDPDRQEQVREGGADDAARHR